LRIVLAFDVYCDGTQQDIYAGKRAMIIMELLHQRGDLPRASHKSGGFIGD